MPFVLIIPYLPSMPFFSIFNLKNSNEIWRKKTQKWCSFSEKKSKIEKATHFQVFGSSSLQHLIKEQFNEHHLWKHLDLRDMTSSCRLGHIQLGLIIPCLVLDAMNLFWFYKIFIGACKLFPVRDKIAKPVSFAKENLERAKEKILPHTFHGFFSSRQGPERSNPEIRKHID